MRDRLFRMAGTLCCILRDHAEIIPANTFASASKRGGAMFDIPRLHEVESVSRKASAIACSWFWVKKRQFDLTRRGFREAGYSAVRFVSFGTSPAFVRSRYRIARAAGVNASAYVKACQSMFSRAPKRSW
jgi:hypothetical protein